MLKPEHTLYYNPNLAWRIIDREVVIIPLESLNNQEPRVKLLNSVGSRIWELIDGTRKVEDIIKILYEEFDTSYKQLSSDVVDFLSRLIELNLVKAKDRANEASNILQ